jgi:hypothetical protein
MREEVPNKKLGQKNTARRRLVVRLCNGFHILNLYFQPFQKNILS